MLRRFFRNNSLSFALFSIFALCWVGQSLTGWRVANAERRRDGSPPLGYPAYLHSSHFAEATFENWESEFLGLGCVVLFAVWLRQKGSPESKPCDELAGAVDPDEDQAAARQRPEAPWPVRHGGWVRAVYDYSLSLALFGLFTLFFALHADSSTRKANAQARLRGEPQESVLAHLGSAEFWFESLQNWQSEFLSEAVIIVLAIYLRQRGSPQSKPVAAPHAQTGGD